MATASGIDIGPRDADRAPVLAVLRIAAAAVAVAAVGTQLVDSIDAERNIVNFFSFFTIQSNLIFLVVLLVGGVLGLRGRSLPHWDLVRGAAAAYMITTGVVYVLLLAGIEEDLQTTLPWVNFVLHYLMPVVALADWVVDRPRAAIPFRRALIWLAFPLLWLIYTVIRGAATDWFPYPFLDPAFEDQGVAPVVLTSVVILVAFTGLVWLMARTSGWRLRARSHAEAH